MREINQCVMSGCKGRCCQNIDLELTEAERQRLFPQAVWVASVAELNKTRKRKGVFYAPYTRDGQLGSGYVKLAINGPCPNRARDGSCLKHDEREAAARNFQFGRGDCNAVRQENGLGPIFLEPVE